MINGAIVKMEGWQSSTKGITQYEDLPKNAKIYIERIEEETHVPCTMIGTGQEREEMILRI